MFNLFSFMPKPFNEGWLPERDGHEIYYCQYGNPQGIPVLSFHGGPGGSSKPKYAKLFNLKKYRFIQFDQRGGGKSKYRDLLNNNTTAYLLDDAKQLLEHLDIKSPVIVNGASWGSTMALLFAEAYPEKVSKIVISSVFLARPYDTDWVDVESERFYPDIWAEMRKKINGSDVRKEYTRLLFSERLRDNIKALTYLGAYEYMLGQLDPHFEEPEAETLEQNLKPARIAFHYAKHKYFISGNQILRNALKIRRIPTLIVHNRMDFCCPPKQAWDLHRALPKSELLILPEYGHSSPEILQVMKKRLKTFL